MLMIYIEEYINDKGFSAFSLWFNQLDSVAAAKVLTALYRMEQGNFSNTKSLGGGIIEYKIDFGPGYRLYFGKDGTDIVILLGGGIKKGQQNDISFAKTYWKEYKSQKKTRK